MEQCTQDCLTRGELESRDHVIVLLRDTLSTWIPSSYDCGEDALQPVIEGVRFCLLVAETRGAVRITKFEFKIHNNNFAAFVIGTASQDCQKAGEDVRLGERVWIRRDAVANR